MPFVQGHSCFVKKSVLAKYSSSKSVSGFLQAKLCNAFFNLAGMEDGDQEDEEDATTVDKV